MCYGNSNQQGMPSPVQNFANTSNYQGQVAGVPNQVVNAQNQIKMNNQNQNNPSVLFGGSSPAKGSAKMIK